MIEMNDLNLIFSGSHSNHKGTCGRLVTMVTRMVTHVERSFPLFRGFGCKLQHHCAVPLRGGWVRTHTE